MLCGFKINQINQNNIQNEWLRVTDVIVCRSGCCGAHWGGVVLGHPVACCGLPIYLKRVAVLCWQMAEGLPVPWLPVMSHEPMNSKHFKTGNHCYGTET